MLSTGCGMTVRFGFVEMPAVPRWLRAGAQGCPVIGAVYFAARDEVVRSKTQPRLPGRRRTPFSFMYRNGVRTRSLICRQNHKSAGKSKCSYRRARVPMPPEIFGGREGPSQSAGRDSPIDRSRHRHVPRGKARRSCGDDIGIQSFSDAAAPDGEPAGPARVSRHIPPPDRPSGSALHDDAARAG